MRRSGVRSSSSPPDIEKSRCRCGFSQPFAATASGRLTARNATSTLRRPHWAAFSLSRSSGFVMRSAGTRRATPSPVWRTPPIRWALRPEVRPLPLLSAACLLGQNRPSATKQPQEHSPSPNYPLMTNVMSNKRFCSIEVGAACATRSMNPFPGNSKLRLRLKWLPLLIVVSAPSNLACSG